MKKTGVLGATILTSTILFAGVSNNHAYAANVDEKQASESVKNLVENNSNYQPKSETQYVVDKEGTNPVKNSYKVAFGEEPNQAPSFLYVDKDTGDIFDPKGNLVQKASHEKGNPTKQEGTVQQENKAQHLPDTGQANGSNIVELFGSLLLAAGALFSIKSSGQER